MSDKIDPYLRSLSPFLQQARLPSQNAEDTPYLDDPTIKGATSRDRRGTIINFNQDTHMYLVETSQRNPRYIARLLQDSGDKRQLGPGTEVAISYAYGDPLIIGVIPDTHNASNNTTGLNFTGTQPTSLDTGQPTRGNAKLPNTPSDVGPDDWVQTDPEGTAGVGVLTGGVAMMKAGMSQVQLHTINDLINLVCQNYRLKTSMGTSEVKNAGGRITWKFRGGSDQLKEAGSTQENWTIRVDLGADGDMFNFELTRPNGTALFRLHVDNDGKIELFGAGGFDLMSGGGDHTQKHLENREIVVKKTDDQTIHGEQTKTLGSDRTTTVGGTDTLTAGNDAIHNVGRHCTDTIGGVHTDKVVGGPTKDAKPGSAARSTVINNGSWKIDIGNTANGASPAAQASHILDVFMGDIKHNITKKGDVEIGTFAGAIDIATKAGTARLDGTKVKLGNALTATHPGMHGDTHGSLMDAYLTTRTTPMPTYLTQTQLLSTALLPPMLIVFAIPIIGHILFFIIIFA